MDRRYDTPRFDGYKAIHKALRAFMGDTLAAASRMDPHDACDVAKTVEQIKTLLSFCRAHLHHENCFVHPAMEARAPGSSERVAGEHQHHARAIEELALDVLAVETTGGADREAAVGVLYRNLAHFIGENFVHMHVEETANNAVLWRAYTDAELLAIERELVASLTPEETARAARWMVPALNPAERVQFLSGVRQAAPPPAFAAVLALVRPHLTDLDWRKLTTALASREAA
ncbi:MAG TPA: hemerythrin domain-containing protein [Stellaceae bacterium]|nr:hemerythrin domain-containing protein [Stellaceae bacterium]